MYEALNIDKNKNILHSLTVNRETNLVTPNFKEEIECINLCAPRNQSHT